MQQLVLAGLPVLAAACGDGRAGLGPVGSGTGGGGTGGALVGSGGAGIGTGGVGSGSGGSVSSGGMGGGGAGGNRLSCQPFNVCSGTPDVCPPFGATDAGGFPLPVETATGAFDPNDSRWADLYRSCLDSGPACTECGQFCRAVLQGAGRPTGTGKILTCQVACEPSPTFTATYVSAVCGRRCIRSARRRRGHAGANDVLGQYLAQSAQLEAESVPAFARLARGLSAFDAPEDFVASARAAMTEEARHWSKTRLLARKHGGRPVKPVVERADFASLADLAADNLAEGCVRETYGALVAAHQATAAADPGVRALMTDIAADELGHAALSWKIDRWANARLGARFQARRQRTAERAVAELLTAARAVIAPRLVVEAGLPSAELAEALVSTACVAVWGPNFSAGVG